MDPFFLPLSQILRTSVAFLKTVLKLLSIIFFFFFNFLVVLETTEATLNFKIPIWKFGRIYNLVDQLFSLTLLSSMHMTAFVKE